MSVSGKEDSFRHSYNDQEGWTKLMTLCKRPHADTFPQIADLCVRLWLRLRRAMINENLAAGGVLPKLTMLTIHTTIGL